MTTGNFSEEIGVNTLSSDGIVAISGDGKGVKDLKIPFNEWLEVLSEGNVLSDSVSGVGHAEVVNGFFCINLSISLVSLCPGLEVFSSSVNGILVPFDGWDVNGGSVGDSDKSENGEFHIFLIYNYCKPKLFNNIFSELIF